MVQSTILNAVVYNDNISTQRPRDQKNIIIYHFRRGTKDILIICILLTVTIFSSMSCSQYDSPTSPEDDANVIYSTSFENNGTPSFEGWRFSDSSATNFFTFSNDVPPNSGNWSLELRADTTKKKHTLSIRKQIAFPSGRRFILSFAVKTAESGQGTISGTVDFSVWSKGTTAGWYTSQALFQQWKTIVVDPVFINGTADSIGLDLYVLRGQQEDRVWYDNFKIQAFPK